MFVRHIDLSRIVFNVELYLQRNLRTYQVPSEITINAPTAQLEATITPIQAAYSASMLFQDGGHDLLVPIPRMTPIPSPLAIPLKRLFLAQGMSPIFCKSSLTDILFLMPNANVVREYPVPTGEEREYLHSFANISPVTSCAF